jgi:hypothetical protein
LELRILKELEGDFAELRIVKDLGDFFRKPRGWVLAARQGKSVEQNTQNCSTENIHSQLLFMFG